MGQHLTRRGAQRAAHEDVVDLAVGAPRRPRAAHDRALPARHEHGPRADPTCSCRRRAPRPGGPPSRGRRGARPTSGANRSGGGACACPPPTTDARPPSRRGPARPAGPGPAAAGRRTGRGSPRRRSRRGRAPRCWWSRARPHAIARAPVRGRAVAAARRSTGGVDATTTPPAATQLSAASGWGRIRRPSPITWVTTVEPRRAPTRSAWPSASSALVHASWSTTTSASSRSTAAPTS